mmetsp:Transcript_20484/g.47011  ORF Transcript_20484/g.47011 Transcript_20484/m.47011 type:complete len:251 (+) Transcript_20484:667-1419(+)
MDKPKGLSSNTATISGAMKVMAVSREPFALRSCSLVTKSAVLCKGKPATAFTCAPVGILNRAACESSSTSSTCKSSSISQPSDTVKSMVTGKPRANNAPPLKACSAATCSALGTSPAFSSNLRGTVSFRRSIAVLVCFRLLSRTKATAPQSSDRTFMLCTSPTPSNMARTSASVVPPGNPLTYKLSDGGGVAPLPWYLTTMGFGSFLGAVAACWCMPFPLASATAPALVCFFGNRGSNVLRSCSKRSCMT